MSDPENQDVFEFRLRRKDVFAGRTGGLRILETDEEDFTNPSRLFGEGGRYPKESLRPAGPPGDVPKLSRGSRHFLCPDLYANLWPNDSAHTVARGRKFRWGGKPDDPMEAATLFMGFTAGFMRAATLIPESHRSSRFKGKLRPGIVANARFTNAAEMR